VPSPEGAQRAWTFRFGKMIQLWSGGIQASIGWRIWTSQMGFLALYDLKSQSLSQISQETDLASFWPEEIGDLNLWHVKNHFPIIATSPKK